MHAFEYYDLISNSYQVVTKDSAIIDHGYERRDSIHADHVGMTKFSAVGDQGYKKVVHAIMVLVEGIQDSVDELAAATQST